MTTPICEDCGNKPGMVQVTFESSVCNECLQDYGECKVCGAYVAEHTGHVFVFPNDTLYLCDDLECWSGYLEECDYCGQFRLKDDGGLSEDGSIWACTECQITYWADDDEEDEDEN